MGLGDVTDKAREKMEEWDDDDLDELASDIEEAIEEYNNVRRVVLAMDSDMEEVKDRMTTIENRLSTIEEQLGVNKDDEQGFLDGDEEDGGGGGGGMSWK